MKRTYFLFWQAFSLQIAYIMSNIYLNLNNYVNQLDEFFHINFNVVFNTNLIGTMIIFLLMIMIPNLYVFVSFHSIKDDLVNRKVQRDINIKPYENYIEINRENFSVIDSIDKSVINFALLSSLFPFIIDYQSLVYLLLYFVTLLSIGIVYTEGPSLLLNPYLLLKYNIFVLQNNKKRLYIIIEKEKEFERPRFSDYVIDWYYDHLILIGFKESVSFS